MLNRLATLFFSLLFTSSALKSQGATSYELTGQIQGLAEGEKVIACLIDPTGHYLDKRDSTYVKNGQFKLQGTVPDGPREYLMFFGQHRWLMDILINNGENISIRSNEDLTTFNHSYINNYVTVYGSVFYNKWQSLGPAYWLYEKSIGNLKRSAQHLVDSIGFNGPLVNQIFQSVDKINKAFSEEIFTTTPYQNSPECTIGFPMLAYTVFVNSNHAAFMVNAYEQMSPQMQNSFFGKKLKEYITLCVGQPFPEFTLPAPDGKIIALKDVASKSKLTLVHFWGADSYIKKQLQDELRVLYKKYHEKGLNIIGFYTDKYADQWRDLVQKEQYPWYNVSDSKGEDGMAAKVYHEYIAPGQKIPNTTNVLIDEQGKIVAWDVYGVELQWYLWKYFGQ